MDYPPEVKAVIAKVQKRFKLFEPNPTNCIFKLPIDPNNMSRFNLNQAMQQMRKVVLTKKIQKGRFTCESVYSTSEVVHLIKCSNKELAAVFKWLKASKYQNSQTWVEIDPPDNPGSMSDGLVSEDQWGDSSVVIKLFAD